MADHHPSDELLEARVQLSRVAMTGSLDALLQATLDAAEHLTGSSIGFFHFVDADQETLTLQAWSTNTLAHMCTADGKHSHYPISAAGVWVDCFHARGPVIHNDYQALQSRRGMPEGHATVTRELVVPMIRDGLVTAIIGVGNKPTHYDSHDIEVMETLVAMAMDVVDRKRAEEALAASEARFRGLFETMAQGVVYQRADGTVSSANPAALRILGLTFDELVKRNSFSPEWHGVREDGSPFPGDEHPTMVAMRTGREVRDVVIGILNATTRERRWILANAVPWFPPGSQKPDGAFVTFEDISERKRVEEERLRAVQREHRIQRLESLAGLAGGIAHDFNNLLTAVLGFAESARSVIDADSPASDDLAEIIDAGRRAAELCRQMLAISGKGRFVTGRVALTEVVRRAAPELEQKLPVGVRLVLDLAADELVPSVSGDEELLARLLDNLVTNACEALEEKGGGGEIRLTVGVTDCQRDELDHFVGGESMSPGRFAYLEVSDDGPGMPPESLGRIYEPFFSTKFVGRGLGLPEALGIARAHAGSLRLTTSSAGTQVRMLVPLLAVTRPATITMPARVAPAEASALAPLLLVVDDEATLRLLAQRTLELAGFRVLLAVNGREAIDLYQAHLGEVALVVLDLTMPVLDGDGVLRELAAIDPHARVVLSSGYSATEVEVRFAHRGVAGFLPKPYTPEQLRAKVAALLPEVRPAA